MHRLFVVLGIPALALVAACADDGSTLEVAIEDCQPGRLRYIHDLALDGGVTSGNGDLTITGHAFSNVLGAGALGTLDLHGPGGVTLVHVEFEDLLAVGETVDARGSVKLVDQGIEAGNCETAGFTGRISDFGDGWRFTFVDLHASPFCGGATLRGSFAGCTRSTN